MKIVQALRDRQHRVLVARVVRAEDARRGVPEGVSAPTRLHEPVEIEQLDIRADATTVLLDEHGERMELAAWTAYATSVLNATSGGAQ